jgi:hypothetical protein
MLWGTVWLMYDYPYSGGDVIAATFKSKSSTDSFLLRATSPTTIGLWLVCIVYPTYGRYQTLVLYVRAGSTA